ncbi:MAG TPA: F0F1 ATP synthase subunit A [Acidimicrobiales bacterium]|nr:F0F1 ATP synthase subunit A [Acidimicrobiales bacterium]
MELSEIGATPQVEIGGVVVNVATLASSALAGALVVGCGLWARRQSRRSSPSGLVLAWEATIAAVESRLGPAVGSAGRRAVPLAISLFGFILVANWAHLIPGWPLPAPTADLNLALALAAVVVASVHVTSLRARGWRGYLAHYARPYPWMLPLNMLEELARPLSLALRLYGTMFAGGLMVLLIGELLPAYLSPLPHAAWSVFEVAAGAMQALIFSLLTVLYHQAALGSDRAARAEPIPNKELLVQ